MSEPTPSPLNARQKKAAEIAANPSGYKVCEGCESIVGTGVVLCPNCHSFRFDGEAQRVIEQARLLGSRDQTSVTMGDMS
ncbi:hypothetical protein HNR46_001281 [Haloferula luteola]|uniref:Uncharacterized protein n=1 Tax=Haloferula luteola TaxID=595692 RepID=A0A840UY21_9BACT|nr:hypothetical protein [Haloferula luteola]MBB5351047.1 hypothetical protein [Haloferula luteola]